MRRTPESSTLRACLDYLALCKIAAWRINVQGVPLHDGSGGWRKAPSTGIADIIAVGRMPCDNDGAFPRCGTPNPHPIAVECKSACGRQSPAQREFQRKWEAAGGLYVLARSVDELRTALRDAGVEVK